jgi:hypothetical protein
MPDQTTQTTTTQPTTTQQVEKTTEVKSETPRKPLIKKPISLIILLAIIAALVYIIITVIGGLNNSVKIVEKGKENCDFDHCMIFTGHFEDGWAVWEIAKNWPLNFTVSASGFAENQPLTISCPVDYNSGDSELMAKAKFFVNKSRVKECVVK